MEDGELFYVEGYAMRAGEDLGDGTIITEQALRNAADQLEKLRGKPIVYNWDHTVPPAGIADDFAIDSKGILVKGRVRKDLKKDGFYSISGKVMEKSENTVTKLAPISIGWIKTTDERLRRAEKVAELASILRKAEWTLAIRTTQEAADIVLARREALDKAIEDWEALAK